jgi:hypothetical protein
LVRSANGRDLRLELLLKLRGFLLFAGGFQFLCTLLDRFGIGGSNLFGCGLRGGGSIPATCNAASIADSGNAAPRVIRRIVIADLVALNPSL